MITNKLFILLRQIIPISFISVSNSDIESVYSFHIENSNGDVTFVELVCSYSHTSTKNIYASYKLYIDDDLVDETTGPVFDSNLVSKRPATEHTQSENRLETLMRICSLKVIQQEYESHKRHMLKTFMNEQNTQKS